MKLVREQSVLLMSLVVCALSAGRSLADDADHGAQVYACTQAESEDVLVIFAGIDEDPATYWLVVGPEDAPVATYEANGDLGEEGGELSFDVEDSEDDGTLQLSPADEGDGLEGDLTLPGQDAQHYTCSNAKG